MTEQTKSQDPLTGTSSSTGQDSSWLTESERKIVSTPVVTIVERVCRSSRDGRQAPFYVLQSNDWCNIIPITETGCVVMVRQYRIGVAKHTLELPGGVMDDTDHSPQDAALREMTEETGYVPTSEARCISLGSVEPNPAILDNRSHFFLVSPVRKERDQALDPNEMIETIEVPIEDIPKLISEGRIAHALMLNVFFRAMLSVPETGPMLSGILRRLGRVHGPERD